MSLTAGNMAVPPNTDSVVVRRGTERILPDTIQVKKAGVKVIVWQKQKNYFVVFLPNGGMGSMAGQAVKVGEGTKLDENVFSRRGYLFNGWDDGMDGKPDYTDGQMVTDAAPAGTTLTLRALWIPITWYVQYNGNGADSGSMKRSAHAFDKVQELTANAYRKLNRRFLGWAVSATGAVRYADKASVKNLKNIHGDVLNLYAKWEQIQGDRTVHSIYTGDETIYLSTDSSYSDTNVWTGIDTSVYRGIRIRNSYASVSQNWEGRGVTAYLSTGRDRTEIGRAYCDWGSAGGAQHNDIGVRKEYTLEWTQTSGKVNVFLHGEPETGKEIGNGSIKMYVTEITLLAR